jgi:hypothetical protein
LSISDTSLVIESTKKLYYQFTSIKTKSYLLVVHYYPLFLC